MESLEKIKLFITDLDGTLTNGQYYVSSNGVLMKSFYSRDFQAMNYLYDSGIKIMIATQAGDEVIDQKISSLPFEIILHKGLMNKVPFLNRELDKLGIGWQEVAYIGDGKNDFACMCKAGLTCCPKDSCPILLGCCQTISDYNGGKGAVEQFCYRVLEYNDNV